MASVPSQRDITSPVLSRSSLVPVNYVHGRISCTVFTVLFCHDYWYLTILH